MSCNWKVITIQNALIKSDKMFPFNADANTITRSNDSETNRLCMENQSICFGPLDRFMNVEPFIALISSLEVMLFVYASSFFPKT